MMEKNGTRISKTLKSRPSLWALARGFKNIDDRKFNVATKYVLPTDAGEINRLHLQHYAMRQLVHGNFNAPVEDLLEQGIRVLDVGCGNGTWTLEMAADFPNSTFVGIDAASLFPSNVPFNCSFIKANTLKGLPFKDGAFDFVFMRFMVFSFTPNDWAVTVRELSRLTRPGGWLELFEHSIQLERPPPNVDILNAVLGTIETKGIDVKYVWELKNLLIANKFTKVEGDYIHCPLGWGGRAGELHAQNCLMVYLAMQPLLSPRMNLTKEEFKEQAIKLVENYREYRTWHKAPYVYGRKPLI